MASFLDQSYTYKPYRPENLARRRFFGFLKLIVVWFVIFQIVNAFFVTTFRMENTSMSPTLEKGEKVLASPLVFGPELKILGVKFPALVKPKRGDMVIASLPRRTAGPLFFRIIDPLADFFTGHRVKSFSGKLRKEEYSLTLKRIIGIPGDTLKIEDYAVFIKPASEKYYMSETELISRDFGTIKSALPEGWKANFPFSGNIREFTLKDNEYFLLGDNRSASSDSAYWGPVTGRELKSRVILRYWPFRNFHVM